MRKVTAELKLVVGFTASNAESVRLLLADLLPLHSIIAKIVICDNNSGLDQNPEILSAFSRTDVKVCYISTDEIVSAARVGVFGEYYKSKDRQNGIAFGRTALHHYLYLESLGVNDAVVWILDDDVRLNLSNPQDTESFIETLHHLRSQGIDIAIGRIAGDPPIPGAVMLRTQLLDLDFNLKALCNPDRRIDTNGIEAQNKENICKYPDFYYDLSLRHKGHLETPWWYVEDGCTDRLQLLEHMLERVRCIPKGANVFRRIPISIRTEDPTDEDIITRGGNTFVLNTNCLRDYANLAPQINDISFRRGDTLWTILNRRTYAKVSTIDLPVFQDRSSISEGKLTLRTALADILGGAFTRALDRVLAGRKSNLERCDATIRTIGLTETEINEVLSLFDTYLQTRLSLLYINSWRIRGLVDSIRSQINNVLSNDSAESAIIIRHADSVTAVLRSIESLYSEKSIRELQDTARRISRGQLRLFLRNLDQYMKSYKERLPPRHRSNGLGQAMSFVRQDIAHTDVKVWYWGNEGFIMTDGSFAYKYFHDGLSNFKEGQLEFIRKTLTTSAFARSKHILPLERVVEKDKQVIFVSRFLQGHHYSGGKLLELLDLLRECKQYGIVLTNISPENIIVNGDVLVYVDLGRSIEPFTPEGFRQMCKRAYLVYRWHFRTDIKDLLHRSLHDESMPEMFGFENFLAALEEKDPHEVLDGILLSLVQSHSAERILDYGCGNGIFTDKLAGISKHVSAYDISTARYRRYQHPEEIAFLDESQISTSMLNSSFSLVLCSLVLCTVDDKMVMKIITDLRRLVSLNGFVILSFCNPFNLDNEESETHVKDFDCEPRYDKHFSYRKIVKITHKARTEMHRPFSWYLNIIKHAGFEVEDIIETPGTDIRNLSRGSDFIVLVLKPVNIPPRSNVSLLIKASAMEWRTIRHQVNHIVTQLEGPRLFLEKVVAIDEHRGPFARQYDTANLQLLKEELNYLVNDGTIDRIIVVPNDAGSLQSLNMRWFGIDTTTLRCQNGQPTITFLHALEQCTGDYILHIDSDCLVGRLDRKHDYLAEMLKVFKDDPQAATVSLPIASKSRTEYTSQSGSGNWRTEVRCGMLRRSKLFSLLPLHNKIVEGGLLEQPWHRSLDMKVEQRECRSYRGGDPSTFFIHVPNERKPDFNAWYNIMKAVETGRIADCQTGHVNLVGTLEEWMPRRSEECILIVRGRNVPISKLRRCFESILSQSDQDWGIVVVDAGSDNGMDEYIDYIIKRNYGFRITFYRNVVGVPPIANIDTSIRRLCCNPNSIIVMPDADDAFLVNDAIGYVKSLYESGADMAIGGMLRTDKETYYQIDFESPRQNRGGNVWQPLRTFRKYLFDRIPPSDLKINGDWVPHTEDWALMLPMSEMALHPAYMTRIIYLYEPSSLKQILSKDEREALIGQIIAKPAHRREGDA